MERQESVLVQRERMAAELADAGWLACGPNPRPSPERIPTPEDGTEAPGGPPTPLT